MAPRDHAFLSDVSRETSLKLDRFAALVAKWSRRINLVAKADLPDLWSRHIADSAQVVGCVSGTPSLWADLGSGGGFPGIVAAILAQDRWPASRFVLVESDQRKAVFLRTALRELELEAEVIARRIEEVPPLGADVVSARALAGLSRLLELSAPHLAEGAQALFPKGARHAEELAEALESWSFRCEKFPSKTDSDAVILKLTEIRRV